MRRTGNRTVKASWGGAFDVEVGSCAANKGTLGIQMSNAANIALCPPRGPEIVAGGKDRS